VRISLPKPKQFAQIFSKVTNTALTSTVTGICTDSRECLQGDLFIAISGAKVDGNSFIAKARDAGAVAALTSNQNNSIEKIQQIFVENTIVAIGQVANLWRKQFNIQIIGITGSNGKTTTKELLKHFLSTQYTVHATRGNFNTSIGVPLSLLLIEKNDDLSIIEMGANQPGDIKTLCEIAEPTHGLITNIAPAHLEGFGTIKNVAMEKTELFKYLSNGTIFKNLSDKIIEQFSSSSTTITYGFDIHSDYAATIQRENNGNIKLIINDYELDTKSTNPIFAKNILAAAAVANTFNINWKYMQEQVNTFSPAFGRGIISKYGNITVIDDSYNANYSSTLAAIEHLATYPNIGKKIFVFGDMAELGEQAEKYHTKIGEKCIEYNLDAIFTIGSLTKFTDSVFDSDIFHKHFDSEKILINELSEFINSEQSTILFKGSRNMQMEKIIKEVFKK